MTLSLYHCHHPARTHHFEGPMNGITDTKDRRELQS